MASPTSTADSTAHSDDAIRANLGGEPNTLDPQMASSLLEFSVLRQLSQGLLGFDKDLALTPLVASQVPTVENGGISADGLTYTFKLKDGVSWSDGQPLTAGDFVYIFKRLLAAETAGPYSDFFTAIRGGEESLKAADAEAAVKARLKDALGVSAPADDTLVISLSAPNPTFLQKVALVAAAPVRQDLIEEYGTAWTEAGNHVGNGPYVLAEWVHQNYITLKANQNYWGKPPKQKRVRLTMISDVNAELTAFKAGDLDIARVPPGTEAGILKDDALKGQVLLSSQLASLAMFLNTTVEPLANMKVRQAIATGIDRAAWTEKVKNGVGESATGWLPPGLPGFDPSAGMEYIFNVEKARGLLSDAGYPGGDGFPDISLTYVEAGDQGLIAQFLQAQLSENLGIEIELDPLDPPSYGQQVIGGRQFDAALVFWTADYPDPENFLAALFSSESFLDITGYASEEFDRLAGLAATELDQKTRVALWSQAHEVMLADAPIAPLIYVERYYLKSSKVDGLTLTGIDGEIPGDTRLAEVTIGR
ncbi:MAG: peptide ABC transporter substrate-binding protein [Chloroflexi bacterium]|nr:peptide ABC transporter substrate-binding protein [Chloroflexota bacterium]MDA1271388.1 peptide ABC transporter substrate-binding protein [Chloroflexota bacterium]